jgi:seryl-tRNA synthetase
MLDLKFVRENRDAVKENVIRRKAAADVDAILALDERRAHLQSDIERQRAELNAASKTKPDAETIARLRTIGESIREQEASLRQIEHQLEDAASYLPNMSSPEMPVGQGEDDNEEVQVWIPGHGSVDRALLGKTNDLKYRELLPGNEFGDGTPKRHHLDIGQGLGIIDMAQGAAVAGTRFAYLMDGAALLENAVVQLLAGELLKRNFMWVDPPLLVREPVLFGTSHFPEGRDQIYRIAGDNVEESRELYLVGSSEPPLFAYGMGRVFDHSQLPLKMFAVTPCFRSEVGSWGKDVRGIKRVHQFTKLEMDCICPPDQAEQIFQELREINEWLLQRLGLPYRIINKCTGDCGYLATYLQYDAEVWMASQQEFMETMTDTNATDFQARRLNIRYSNHDGKRELAHTVNDTGAALGRIVAAILDTYQRPDGTVDVPEVLRQWVGRDVLEPNNLASLTKS